MATFLGFPVVCMTCKKPWGTCSHSKASSVVWGDIPDSSPNQPEERKSFPNWQPVKCRDAKCGWHGPAAKTVKWFGEDDKQYCPRCNDWVVKHESKGTSP